jgi:hypothetical protein
MDDKSFSCECDPNDLSYEAYRVHRGHSTGSRSGKYSGHSISNPSTDDRGYSDGSLSSALSGIMRTLNTTGYGSLLSLLNGGNSSPCNSMYLKGAAVSVAGDDDMLDPKASLPVGTSLKVSIEYYDNKDTRKSYATVRAEATITNKTYSYIIKGNANTSKLDDRLLATQLDLKRNLNDQEIVHPEITAEIVRHIYTYKLPPTHSASVSWGRCEGERIWSAASRFSNEGWREKNSWW